MAYQCILVAVDLSDEAQEVIATALQQAGYQDVAQLHLVNVIKPLHHTHSGLDLGAVSASVNLDQEIHNHAQQKIQAWANDSGIPEDRTYIKTGNPAAEIKATAETIGADLIVIGTHGRHGLGLLLGSTANGVLHGVGCDVLTVRVH
jgi:universal stress protein A